MKRAWRKKRVYIDTNIFIYIATNHPEYYDKCYSTLNELIKERYPIYGSKLVLFELFGAMSKLNPEAAYVAVLSYLNLPVEMLEPNRETFELAKDLSELSGTTYDSLHASLMMQNGVNTIVTEDIEDWSKIAKAWNLVKKKHDIGVGNLVIIQPSKT